MSTDKLDRVSVIAARQPELNPAPHVSPAVIEFRLQEALRANVELVAAIDSAIVSIRVCSMPITGPNVVDNTTLLALTESRLRAAIAKAQPEASRRISYRCMGAYDWIMIGATDDADAYREALRSSPVAKRETLQRWNGNHYETVQP